MTSENLTKDIYKHGRAHLKAILNSYSEIFFMQGPISGLILLAIGFLNPNTAISGLISVVVAYGFAHFVGFKYEFLKSGFYTYNPLLVGLAIGHLFQISELSILFLALASILTFLLTAMLANLFYLYLGLQILSIPFVIVSSMVYLAAGRFPNLFVNDLYQPIFYQDFIFLPDYVNAFFKAVGSIVFMPNALSGLLICSVVLLRSRLLLLLAILGFGVGTSIHGLFVGSIQQASVDISSFNYILIAVALGGIFNLPAIKSYLIAIIAVALSTILISAVNAFWAQYGIPVFTLPFTIITLSFAYILQLVGYPNRPVLFKATPEETLDYHLSNKDRFPTEGFNINLPFSGSWTVWQGFDGKWTHQGIWRYAYDFVVMDSQNKSYANEGARLEDYYCYRQPVLSPVRGRVVRVVNYLPDNPIGSVDSINNWGNMLMIQDERGVYVELSHFAKDSIAVFEGGWVEPGSFLGLCGNSGYSPQPHIHVQVQASEVIGSATMPFSFAQYVEGSQYHSHGLPYEGKTINSALSVPYYDQLSTFLLDETLRYDVFIEGKLSKTIDIRVAMAVDSTFYFYRGDSKLYFGKLHGSFFVYHMDGKDPYLRMIYLSLASLPMHYEAGMFWKDSISNTVTQSTWMAAFTSLANAFLLKPIITTAQYHFSDEHTIKGRISNSFFSSVLETSITLDPYSKFTSIQLDNIELKRIDHEK